MELHHIELNIYLFKLDNFYSFSPEYVDMVSLEVLISLIRGFTYSI